MSTRSVIAEPFGDSWRGRYHHWDGYPTALGATLWELQHGHFDGDTEAIRDFLITTEPVGWSTINGADFTLPKCWPADENLAPCAECRRPFWQHYRQYYGGQYDTEGLPAPNPAEIVQFGHSPTKVEAPHGPLSYTVRGEPFEGDGQWITPDGDDMGTEWAYVLADDALWIWERFWNEGQHMVGMFGLGADAGEGAWHCVGHFPWNGDEPDFEALENSEAVA